MHPARVLTVIILVVSTNGQSFSGYDYTPSTPETLPGISGGIGGGLGGIGSGGDVVPIADEFQQAEGTSIDPRIMKTVEQVLVDFEESTRRPVAAAAFGRGLGGGFADGGRPSVQYGAPSRTPQGRPSGSYGVPGRQPEAPRPVYGVPETDGKIVGIDFGQIISSPSLGAYRQRIFGSGGLARGTGGHGQFSVSGGSYRAPSKPSGSYGPSQ